MTSSRLSFVLNWTIPAGTVFIWLDNCREDYETFQNRFCAVSGSDSNDWSFVDDDQTCGRLIEEAKERRVVLVSSARLGGALIEAMHNVPQLSSIYIYCGNKRDRETWARAFAKIRGVHSDPEQMFEQMREDLADEAQRTAPAPHSTTDLFAQPATNWSPWETNSCTAHLEAKGRGTIEIVQNEPIPLELFFSNNRSSNDPSAFGLVLQMSAKETSLRVKHDGVFRSLDRTTESEQVLQPADDRWYTYWMSFNTDDGTVKFGIGEIRPNFKIFDVLLSEIDNQRLRTVQYLHVKIENRSRVDEISQFRHKFRFTLGSEPVVMEAALLLVPPSQFGLGHRALTPFHFDLPCRNLYYNLMNFTLTDGNFPDLIAAIERSVNSPTGWCAQKLREKANRFGRPNLGTTSLRFTVDEGPNRANGFASVIEIWPAGHFSPVHHHGNAYGIIRVLHGRILLKLFPCLSLNPRQKPLIEQMLDEGQVTWMLPKLNQTHQMRNVDNDGSCCITVQCYQYGSNDQIHYEYFEFITNDGRRIQSCDPPSDMNFDEFKDLLKKEWQTRVLHE